MLAADAIVVGAGIHGCSAALQLARAGLKVVVFEQAYPGRHASGVNAGGVRCLGRHFAEIPLALASMDLWGDIESLVDDDCGFQPSGQVKVAETQEELEQLEKRVRQLGDLGFSHERLISREELRELVPAVSNHCIGALYCPEDGSAKPFRTVRAFFLAAKKAGVSFHFGEPVQSISHINEIWHIQTANLQCQAPILINAAGAWGNQIAGLLGEQASLKPVALMLMISERMQPFCKPVVGATGRTLSFKQFENGTVLIGGGHQGYIDFENSRSRINVDELAINAQTAISIFPLMKNIQINRCWSGIEGVVEDGIPVIGQSQTHPSAYHVFGFSAHGFQLGPITGKIIRDLVLTGKTSLPVKSFSIARFTN